MGDGGTSIDRLRDILSRAFDDLREYVYQPTVRSLTELEESLISEFAERARDLGADPTRAVRDFAVNLKAVYAARVALDGQLFSAKDALSDPLRPKNGGGARPKDGGGRRPKTGEIGGLQRMRPKNGGGRMRPKNGGGRMRPKNGGAGGFQQMRPKNGGGRMRPKSGGAGGFQRMRPKNGGFQAMRPKG